MPPHKTCGTSTWEDSEKIKNNESSPFLEFEIEYVDRNALLGSAFTVSVALSCFEF